MAMVWAINEIATDDCLYAADQFLVGILQNSNRINGKSPWQKRLLSRTFAIIPQNNKLTDCCFRKK